MTPDDDPTLAEFVAWWLPRRRVRVRSLAPRTTAYYRVLLRVHILPTFGDGGGRGGPPQAEPAPQVAPGCTATAPDRGAS